MYANALSITCTIFTITVTQACTMSHLEWLFPSVHELMSLELGALHECLATLCTHVYTWSMGVQVLPHG